MTTDHVAARTLVKSPPELWAECSDAASLARHIGEFGEITITRLDPETAIAWQGDHATGTVQIEPSGWGTRVTLTAQTQVEQQQSTAQESDAAAPEAQAQSEPAEEEVDAKVEETDAEPDHAVAVDPAPERGRFKRLIGRARDWFRPNPDELDPEPAPVPGLEAELEPEPEPELEPVAVVTEPEKPDPPEASEAGDALDAEAILTAALDSLGQAHHRPFSRA